LSTKKALKLAPERELLTPLWSKSVNVSVVTPPRLRDLLVGLKREYELLRPGRQSLLRMIDEAEVAEAVYNSNAIENSTLTLDETERILLAGEVSRDMDIREVFEAQNLARVTNYIAEKSVDLSIENVLLLHKMLLGNIDDSIAGRFRSDGEYVRVGGHVAPAPEHVERLLSEAIADHGSEHGRHFVDRMARFHARFENIHPFVDGNGRIGRVLVNVQLIVAGFPPVIVRNADKSTYYGALREFDAEGRTTKLERLLALALVESLAKRVAHLSGSEIVTLSEYAKRNGQSVHAAFNAARRQTIRAFREHGHWRIGVPMS
jgi:Fic family protein